MAQCAQCGRSEPFPFTCAYCRMKFCSDHRLAEAHNCFKAKHAKFIRKEWLRKQGTNITSGKFVVVCDVCGFKGESGRLIEIAGQQREDHIKEKGCDVARVFLEELRNC